MFVPGKQFQPSQMFADEARSLTYKRLMRLETPVKYKHSGLLGKLVNYGKMFYNIGSWWQSYKTFFFITYEGPT